MGKKASMPQEIDRLASRYYNIEDKLHLAARKRIANEFKGLSTEDLTSFLLGQASYTMFRNRRHKFQRKQIIRKYPFETVQMDLAGKVIFGTVFGLVSRY